MAEPRDVTKVVNLLKKALKATREQPVIPLLREAIQILTDADGRTLSREKHLPGNTPSTDDDDDDGSTPIQEEGP